MRERISSSCRVEAREALVTSNTFLGYSASEEDTVYPSLQVVLQGIEEKDCDK